jgi:hypothetical protein
MSNQWRGFDRSRRASKAAPKGDAGSHPERFGLLKIAPGTGPGNALAFEAGHSQGASGQPPEVGSPLPVPSPPPVHVACPGPLR